MKDKDGNRYDDYIFNISHRYSWWVLGKDCKVQIQGIYVVDHSTYGNLVHLAFRVYFGKKTNVKNRQQAVALVKKFVLDQPKHLQDQYNKLLKQAAKDRKKEYRRNKKRDYGFIPTYTKDGKKYAGTDR